MSKLRSPLALGAVFAAIVVVLVLFFALGGGVPGNAVAKVGDVNIKRVTFDHWARVAQRQQSASNGAAASVPDPPDFKACIATKKLTSPKPAAGQPNPTDAQFKTQCKSEYDALRDSVVSLLINAQWIFGEAHDQGIKLTDQQVKASFLNQKIQSFPDTREYQAFLKQTGYTTEDLLFRVKVADLTNKLREKILKGKDKVSDAQLRSYFNKNRQQLGQPETRDARVVLAKTVAKANEAKAALVAGQSWTTVAKQYSTDQSSKTLGGLLRGLTKGQLEKALDAAVFKAKKGPLTGPIKTQFGYYIFEIVKIKAAVEPTFENSKSQIKSIIAGEQQQKALNDFVKNFTKKWTDKTECRKGFTTQECSNAPATSTTSTVAPGAVPQSSVPGGADTSVPGAVTVPGSTP
jgi:foldase protein PrsA